MRPWDWLGTCVPFLLLVVTRHGSNARVIVYDQALSSDIVGKYKHASGGIVFNSVSYIEFDPLYHGGKLWDGRLRLFSEDLGKVDTRGFEQGHGDDDGGGGQYKTISQFLLADLKHASIETITRKARAVTTQFVILIIDDHNSWKGRFWFWWSQKIPGVIHKHLVPKNDEDYCLDDYRMPVAKPPYFLAVSRDTGKLLSDLMIQPDVQQDTGNPDTGKSFSDFDCYSDDDHTRNVEQGDYTGDRDDVVGYRADDDAGNDDYARNEDSNSGGDWRLLTIKIDDCSSIKGRDLVARVCLFLVMLALAYRWLFSNANNNGDEAQRPHPSSRPSSSLVIPPRSFTGSELGQGVIQDDNGTTPSQHECAICLETMPAGTTVRILPCRHSFHHDCIVGWFDQKKYCCPLCKFDLRQHLEEHHRAAVEIIQTAHTRYSWRERLLLRGRRGWRWSRIQTDENQLLEEEAASEENDLELTESSSTTVLTSEEEERVIV